MRKFLFLMVALVATFAANAQTFPESIDPGDYNNFTLPQPPAPLTQQILFVGNTDIVQARKGPAAAKQWHDFIGFTPCAALDSCADGELGWVSVNHERIEANDILGDGGGMTVFKVARVDDGSLIIVDQVLEDGRAGKFFNVEFADIVGETGMNCAGITSLADGRIWTAEEWFRYSTNSYFADGNGIRDTTDFTVSTDIAGSFDGQTINKVDNLNWMVEIDPRQAVAIRKQYNWGRQGFEGGVVMPDNQTVYLGEDARPGLFTRFVADTPGDFTSGTLSYYAYDEEAELAYWVDYPNDNFLDMVSMNAYNGQPFGPTPSAATDNAGLPWQGEDAAAMFIRNEWFAADSTNGLVYWAETGNRGFWNEFALFTPRGGELYQGSEEQPYNGKIGNWHLDMARKRFPELNEVSNDDVRNWLVADQNFTDATGRVLCYDPTTEQTFIFLEGGPFPGEDASASDDLLSYPEKHFSNPDGLNFIYPSEDKRFMIICEDLNQNSYNTTPAGVSNRTCELWALDMDIANPTVDDLIRISVVPNGAEVTGAQPTSDQKTLLVNSQHPRSSNPFPFNNSLTYAINGWDKLADLNKIVISDANLMEADADEKIATLENGGVYTFNAETPINFAVTAFPNAPISKVVFDVAFPDGTTMTQTERRAPFASFANDGADLNGESLPAGEYTVTITGFDKEGNAGVARVYTFTVNYPNAPAAATVANVFASSIIVEGDDNVSAAGLNVINNGTSNDVVLESTSAVDAAIYNAAGQLQLIVRDLTHFELKSNGFAKAGTYYVQTAEGTTRVVVAE